MNAITLTDDQKQTIELLEVVALLHDIGKFSDLFLENHAVDGPSLKTYKYELRTDIIDLFPNLSGKTGLPKKLPPLLHAANDKALQTPYRERVDLTSSLKKHILQSWDGEKYNLAELILLASPWSVNVTNWMELVGKNMQPAQLIGQLHGAAHYEKQKVPPSAGQNYQDRPMYRATPFGYEIPISNQGQTKPLSAHLQQLPLTEIGLTTTSRRQEWLAEMKNLLQQGIADTRRSINDVTLWDWGYTVALLTKPAVYTILQQGWPTSLKNLRYKTLRITLDTLRLYSRSDKISDLIGIRDTLNASYSNVQTLLEETEGIGNRLFHDHTGAYYLLPDLDGLGEIKDRIQAQFPADMKPHVALGEFVQLSYLDPQGKKPKNLDKTIKRLLTTPRQNASTSPPVDTTNNFFVDDTIWAEARPHNAELCTVCHTRPVGFPSEAMEPARIKEQGYEISDSWATEEKARSRNICRVCLVRRSRRSSDWLANGQDRTIWTDEVADDNGRLALLVGSLALDDWLSGDLIDTLMAKTGTQPSSKIASPSRIYRVAETGRKFWQEVIDDTTPQSIGQRPYRLAIYPQQRMNRDLGPGHAYELDLGNITLSVVWDSDNARFLTNENLVYFMSRWSRAREADPSQAADFIAGQLTNNTYPILEPSSFLAPRQETSEITVKLVEALSPYTPSIPLMSEPGIGMVLVPASQAILLTQAIKEKYEREMGRVADRLPLHIGLVFFRRRTPLTAVLDAGRQFLTMPSQWQAWQTSKQDGFTVTFSRDGQTFQDEQKFQHRYPRFMGDGDVTSVRESDKTVDNWYPYLLCEKPESDNDLKTKHVRQITDGDTVYIRPSYFDFVYLDTTGRRFSVDYHESSQHVERPTRPFLLNDLDRLNGLWYNALHHLQVSQRHQVIFAIESTREAWHGSDPKASYDDPSFRQFVANTLAGAAWPAGNSWKQMGNKQQQALIAAGIRGELADLAELYMEILKSPREEVVNS